MQDRINSTQFGAALRRQFPVFEHCSKQRGRPLVFLDSAASSQKPDVVIRRISDYLSFEHSNVHRGAYELSAKATDNYEMARATIANFIGAKDPRNIIFTRGTTESVNMAASAIQDSLPEGSAVLLSLLEHHSNIVPWQLIAKRRKLSVHFCDIDDKGYCSIDNFRQALAAVKPKIVAITMLSNAIGTIAPVSEMCQLAREYGALVLLDAAQYAAHDRIKVDELQCDFLAFSGHKLYGPTGSGILYASDRAYSVMEPFMGGGNMISSVSTKGSEWAEEPAKFEAGTPAIAEVLGLATAVDFLDQLFDRGLSAFENSLFEQFVEALKREESVEIYGPAGCEAKQNDCRQAGIVSFNVRGVHPHDFATVADQFNVQIRAGHHCAQPLLSRLGLQSTARLSLGAYSDSDHIEPLLEAIRYSHRVFG